MKEDLGYISLCVQCIYFELDTFLRTTTKSISQEFLQFRYGNSGT
uniref:Cyclin-P3-1 isoform X1 n=1 Tax=Rhizophora mucronata TaxID=61149 RepID=A0A2P2L734_RHIMU